MEWNVGIDSYGLFPLGLNLLETLLWAERHGAAGVHFSGLMQGESQRPGAAELRDLAGYAADHSLYVEWGGGQHIPFDTTTWKRKDVFSINACAAREAEILGTRIVRSCSGSLLRWNPQSPAVDKLLMETARELKKQRSMLRDHNIILAIEAHFEFTTHELLRLFKYCEAGPGDYLGICLDTMNLLVLLEDPVEAAERILPWVVSTHVKDGGLVLTDEGLKTFPVELGKGVVDLRAVMQLLSMLDRRINLSVEDHGGDFMMPVFDPLFLSKFPDLTVEELACLFRLVKQGQNSGLPDPIERSQWPEVCEKRMKKDLDQLVRIARNVNPSPGRVLKNSE